MKVFISHQKADRNEASKIAEYLKNAGISVYFDEYDRELQQATQADDPNRVVAAIKKGIQSSTHMLCIISPNTLYSTWVPFEVGYGHDTTDLATLTLKGIASSDLPDYIRTSPVIRDLYDINKFVEKHGRSYSLESLNEFRNFSKQASSDHPLAGIMDQIITG